MINFKVSLGNKNYFRHWSWPWWLKMSLPWRISLCFFLRGHWINSDPTFDLSSKISVIFIGENFRCECFNSDTLFISRFGTTCLSKSLLELWEFNPEKINSFSTSTQIVKYLASVKRSPVFKSPYKPEEWLGELTYNVDGEIISAQAAKMLYVIKATSGDEMNTKIDVSILFLYYELLVHFMTKVFIYYGLWMVCTTHTFFTVIKWGTSNITKLLWCCFRDEFCSGDEMQEGGSWTGQVRSGRQA